MAKVSFILGRTLFTMMLVAMAVLIITNYFDHVNSNTINAITKIEEKLELSKNSISINSKYISLVLACMIIVGSLHMMIGGKSGWLMTLIAYMSLAFFSDFQFVLTGVQPTEIEQIYILKHTSIIGGILLILFK